MAYCLPPDLTEKFIAALRDGTITPDKLIDMSSEERRDFLGGIVGKDHAEEVNARLESKLILKDQVAGLATWARQTAGLTEPARRDALARISKLDRVLNPTEERTFLADLAAQKLGATVTLDEAKRVSDLATEAKALQKDATENWTPERGTAYGRALNDLDDYVDSLKPGRRGWAHWTGQIANIPRTSLTSILHWSAPFVQGRAMMTDPAWFQAFKEQMRYFANEENYNDLMGYIRGHPDYDLARRAGLSMTDLSDNLSHREEAMQSSLLQEANAWLKEKSGGRIPDAIGASSRSFTGFLNYLRFQSFTRLTAAARAAGRDVALGSKGASDIAEMVNIFTGRASVGTRYEGAMPLLNAVFFAPRKFIAMVQRLNPYNYLSPTVSATARGFATREMVGYVSTVAAVAGLVKLSGGQIGLNPNKSDFLTVTMGKHSFDLTDGEAALIRLMSRVMTNSYTSKAGKETQLGQGNTPDAMSLVLSYMRNKLAPIPAAIVNTLKQQDHAGHPVTPASTAENLFLPITVQEFRDWAKAEPKDYWSLLPGLLVPFGLHMTTDVPRDYGLAAGPGRAELNRLHFSDSAVTRGTGNPRLDALTQQYLVPQVQQRLDSLVRSPGYGRLPDAAKEEALRSMLRALRAQAKARAEADLKKATVH